MQQPWIFFQTMFIDSCSARWKKKEPNRYRNVNVSLHICFFFSIHNSPTDRKREKWERIGWSVQKDRRNFELKISDRKKYQSWRRRQPNQFNLWYFDIVCSQLILFIPVFCHFAHFFMALSLIPHLFFLSKGRRNVLNCIAISPFVSTSRCHLTLFHSPI